MLAAATIAYLAWLVVAHLNQIDRAVLRFPRAVPAVRVGRHLARLGVVHLGWRD
jgi:hypothetical protein